MAKIINTVPITAQKENPVNNLQQMEKTKEIPKSLKEFIASSCTTPIVQNVIKCVLLL